MENYVDVLFYRLDIAQKVIDLYISNRATFTLTVLVTTYD